MQRDIRQTPLYREAEALYRGTRQPGTGQISDAAELHVSADGQWAVFTGSIVETLEGSPPTRICKVNLKSPDTNVLTFGPNADRLPKVSPNDHCIAFLSDRHRAGDFQLHLMDRESGVVRATAHVNGWVEYLHWSPDGQRILLGVADHGADTSSVQGAVTTARAHGETLPWMPTVDPQDEDHRWRSVWVYDTATERVRQVAHVGSNVWEATWCGIHHVAAVTSAGPTEGSWYTARLQLIEVETGRISEVYSPTDQIGLPAACPSGRWLAVVEAICSDRWFVAGDLRVIDTRSGLVQTVPTRGVDLTYIEWRSEQRLLLAGHRGFESVVGIYDVESGEFAEVWSSQAVTTGGLYFTVCGIGDTGDCLLIGESFTKAPEVAAIRGGTYELIKSFDLGYAAQIEDIDSVERLSWSAPDGLTIQGWLLRPKAPARNPLVMCMHGGPIWQWRPTWLGRRGVHLLMLLKRGYAIFLPNPRGSSGQGQEFARRVVGDMGGLDALDCLAGLDHLVDRGVADPKRLGVTGISYGGFMTACLIGRDSRFAAAVSVAPMINYVTQHLLSNIPQFVSLFLADSYTNSAGEYYLRSPVMHAHQIETPTLNICGALDRSAPPEEAVQFHNALLESGVNSALVTYPQEGHGIRKFPAVIDYAARVVSWFEEHMSASRGAGA